MKGAGGGRQWWQRWQGKLWTWDAQQGWQECVDPGNERLRTEGGGAGSAGVPTADPDAMMEVEDLRTKQAWTDFMGAVRDAIAGEPRHALAQHITQACQPKNNQVLQVFQEA